ncbi:ABC transporter ATP-binding protein [Phaeovulum vinaykumarii]|uniref:Putative hydroxymethylpyrimidine transport system ATP-binding protein n=1 Tax=Phaeovulum vinaykumarii TaxID=407234 RepID=A0A1N7LL61_9RHOB|nr:ABC transporter ATP-binding protein [Phaeovulum vinaykumarii]SIS74537.1 putative hydroxymethylpyrimidine transport system ATP-binding protein [Phaeovulum vinaykumarii]SOC05087.1 putative hydroxymethylpyrimidine transport system ATP-binding protein [Phaeovulum vinaykumarii]
MSTAPAITICGHHAVAGRALFAPVALRIGAGEWTCLLGPSGIGKTTLMRLVAGLACAGRFVGEIATSDGKPVSGRASFMAQTDLLLPWLSVLENAVLGARLRGEAPDLPRARALLCRIGLGAHLQARPRALSGGMRQRVALARTLLEDRPIAFLDEPFSALDAQTRAAMQELAAESLAGKTVLLVTHDPAEAVRLGHQIVVLTAAGAHLYPVPPARTPRDAFAPDCVAAQAGLMAILRGQR